VLNNYQAKRFLSSLKKRDYPTLIRSFLYVAFRFLGLLFSIPAIIILWIIKPFVWIKLGCLHSGRFGHLAFNTDLFMRRRQLGIHPNGPFYCFLSNPKTLTNRQLLNMWKRVIPVYESSVLCWLYFGMLPILKRTPFYQNLDMNSNEYYEFNNAKPSLHFNADEIEKGRKLLNLMGVDLEKDEYVCIFARDDAYLKRTFPNINWDYHDSRNSDIDTLIETIKFLIEKGFTVIRIGSIVNKPISFTNKKLIDYPYSVYQSDFLDIFISAHCKFVLTSGGSGMTDIATIFDKPMLAVNIGEFGYTPLTKNCLYIPKKYKYNNTNEYLHFRDAQKLARFWHNPAAFGLQIEDNSPQEILEVTKEMLAILEGQFEYSSESAKLMQAYHKLWKESDVSANLCKTPIGSTWLKNNRALYF
jgi:putative glycosyltransferase (TIGR04372 family)